MRKSMLGFAVTGTASIVLYVSYRLRMAQTFSTMPPPVKEQRERIPTRIPGRTRRNVLIEPHKSEL